MNSLMLSIALGACSFTENPKRQRAVAVQNVAVLLALISRLRLGVRQCSAAFDSRS